MEPRQDGSPLVSLIVPVYNVAPYLRESLDSALAQTYGNLEIILVDDGSEDGSGAICAEYAARDPRVRLIRQENRGLSAARNTGLAAMRGELVAFLDPDDAFRPDMIGLLWERMRETGADMATGGFTMRRTEGRLSEVPPFYTHCPGEGALTSAEALRALVRGRIASNVWDKLYRRELWRGLAFPEGRNYEDVTTTFAVIRRAERVALCPETLVLHRKRPGSITETCTEKNIRDSLLARRELEEGMRRTEGVYAPEDWASLRNRMLRTSVSTYAQAIAQSADAETVALIRGEIDRLRGELENPEPRTRGMLALYRLCPRALPAALEAWRRLKGICGR